MDENFTYKSFDLHGNSIWAFKRILKDQEVIRLEPSTESDDETERENFYICRACGNVIASPAEKLEIDGKFSHTFVNPAGIIYNIVCFSDARGCIIFGDPITDFTWFPGFGWSYALCSNCQAHLGWYYSSEGKGFYGLILDNIIENL